MKKFLAFILVMAMMCCVLVSCNNVQKQTEKEDDASSQPIAEPTAQELLEEADNALLTAPYKMTITMDFGCDDEMLDQAFSMMSMEIPVVVDGNNILMNYSMNVMGYNVEMEITLVDSVMYYNMNIMDQTEKMKCTLTEEQYQEFMQSNNTQKPLSFEQFGELTAEKKDGKTYIDCTQISEEGIAELNKQLADSLSSLGAEASFKDLTYYIVLKDGKYESMNMDCDYTMTLEGKTYTVNMAIGYVFDYSEAATVAAPADANDYREVDYAEIMGQ